MKAISALLVMLTLGLLAGGCRSDRHDVVLSDLMREIDAQNAATTNVPAQELDEPDAPIGTVNSTQTLAGSLGVESGANFVPLNEVESENTALTIQADSVLRIQVAEDPGLSGSYPVNNLGGISLGYIGPVILDNLTEAEAATKISHILTSREFQTANVTVKILRPSYDKVRIAGAVRQPGIIKVGAGDEIMLNSALIQAGGIVDTPWRTQVKVVRGGLTSMLSAYLPGEVYALVDENKEPLVPDVKLRNNDVVFVFTRTTNAKRGVTAQRWVLVLGEVRSQGFYKFEVSERFTMMNLVFRMGGFPPYANEKAVRVIRTSPDGVEQEYKVNVRDIMREGDPTLDFPLEPGDRIVVPSRGISFF